MAQHNRAKWYVYELIDPRDRRVFYVGKGTKDRIYYHEREARRDNYTNQSKVDRIRAIWRDGLEVVKQKIAYFWDEAAAYTCETQRIKEYDCLTNIVKGGKARPKQLSFLKLVSKIIQHERVNDQRLMWRYFHRSFLLRLPRPEYVQLYDSCMRFNCGSRH